MSQLPDLAPVPAPACLRAAAAAFRGLLFTAIPLLIIYLMELRVRYAWLRRRQEAAAQREEARQQQRRRLLRRRATPPRPVAAAAAVAATAAAAGSEAAAAVELSTGPS